MNGWVVVGYCPKCGAPMYAPSVWWSVTPPPVYRTCNCFPQGEIKTTISCDDSL